jgi:hypothetical protein
MFEEGSVKAILSRMIDFVEGTVIASAHAIENSMIRVAAE